METRINYHTRSPAIAAAWLRYKETHPGDKLSVWDFMAGYNAALAALDTNRGYQSST